MTKIDKTKGVSKFRKKMIIDALSLTFSVSCYIKPNILKQFTFNSTAYFLCLHSVLYICICITCVANIVATKWKSIIPLLSRYGFYFHLFFLFFAYNTNNFVCAKCWLWVWPWKHKINKRCPAIIESSRAESSRTVFFFLAHAAHFM